MEFGNNLIPFIICCTQVLLLSLLLLSTVVKLYECEFSMKSNDSNINFFFFSFLFSLGEMQAKLREAASLEKHVLLKKLRDALESLRGRVAGRNKDDVEEAIAMVSIVIWSFIELVPFNFLTLKCHV